MQCDPMIWDSAAFWDRRYASGRTSGPGSEGDAARFKAETINRLIAEYNIGSVVDWGCGDGTVLSMITDDVDYVGVDISRVALRRLAQWSAHRRFVHLDDAAALTADLALSLDVIFHQVDNGNYHRHLEQIFGSARRLVLVHATDHDGGRTATHVRWRRWTPDIPDGWQIIERPADPAAVGFYLCERR
jgi:SAM-dependent methyltransferase